jgi:Isochorismatase family
MLLSFLPEQGAGGTMDHVLLELDAEPERIELDLARTAVIVVDMQNDFGTPGGIFDRAGIDITSIQKAVGPTRHVLAAARKAGIRIIYLKMGFRPDLSDLGAEDSPNRIRHLCRFHNPRRNVPGLPLRATGRLHRGAHWWQPGPQQS